MWLNVISRFEGIADAINISFVKEFAELITNTKGSVYEAKQQYVDLIGMISKNFSTLQGFLDYLG